MNITCYTNVRTMTYPTCRLTDSNRVSVSGVAHQKYPDPSNILLHLLPQPKQKIKIRIPTPFRWHLVNVRLVELRWKRKTNCRFSIESKVLLRGSGFLMQDGIQIENNSILLIVMKYYRFSNVIPLQIKFSFFFYLTSSGIW